MPNPFLKLGAANTSTVDVDRPTALTPIPERMAGNVFAYRGTESHGVEPTGDYEAPEDYTSEEDYEQQYEGEPVPETPVPVYIVQSGGRELRRFRVTRVLSGAVGGNSVQVVGGDPLRRKVSLINTHATDTVYIGSDQQSASAMHGYPVAPGQSFETDSNDSAVWAISATANAVQLAVRIEYSVMIGD